MPDFIEKHDAGIKHSGIKLVAGYRNLDAQIALPSSKSESNRALLVQALSKGKVQVVNVSNAADTQTMLKLLSKISSYTKAINSSHPDSCQLDVGPAGTVMRFLTAYLSIQKGRYLLTGSARMQQRPIKILVEALQSLGADLVYDLNDGYPPLYIVGKNLQGNQVKIAGDISSQYISALLMIAPVLDQGLKLELIGELTSRPYVQMTLNMMKEAGIYSSWQTNIIQIGHQEYKDSILKVESDWSGASYWFSVAALSDEANIFLLGLKQESLQGDRAICSIMEHFGVNHAFEPGGLRISKSRNAQKQKSESEKSEFEKSEFEKSDFEKSDFRKSNLEESNLEESNLPLFDFRECPDLAQTVIACAAGLGIGASFTGLETLRIKETDRITALDNELGKMGVSIIQDGLVFHLDVSKRKIPTSVFFKTYEDHRMAMALAPLALVIPEIAFDEANVVEKSYPTFWDDLRKAGFHTQLD